MPLIISKNTKKYMPFLLATAIFMQMLDSTILNTALPSIAKDLHQTPLKMQSIIVSYVLTLALFIPVNGYLADRFGTKKIFILALVLFSLGSLFCSMSKTLTQLDLSRVFQGLGGALMTPVARLAMLKTYPKNQMVKAMNFAVIPALVGPIVGPLIGGYLVEVLSWHWIFYINLPIGVLAIFFSFKYMPDFVEKKNKLDVKGFLIFGTASIVLSVALEVLGKPNMTIYVLPSFMIGFLLFYIYFLYARKANDPIFPLHLFKVRTFRVGIIGNLITRLGISSIPLLVPLLIQIGYGKSASFAGWMVAPMALAAIFIKPLTIPILERLGYKLVLRFNTMLIGIFILLLAIPNENINIYWYIPIIVVMGFLNSLQFTAMNSITIANLRDYQNSSGNSLLSVDQQLAIGFGIAIGMSVLSFYQHSSVLGEEETLAAFRYTFVTVGVLTILSAFVFARLHKKDGENLNHNKEKK